MSNFTKIKFIGKNQPAPEFITDGNIKIDLPKDQSQPFAHEHRTRILRVAPELYKPVLELRNQTIETLTSIVAK